MEVGLSLFLPFRCSSHLPLRSHPTPSHSNRISPVTFGSSKVNSPSVVSARFHQSRVSLCGSCKISSNFGLWSTELAQRLLGTAVYPSGVRIGSVPHTFNSSMIQQFFEGTYGRDHGMGLSSKGIVNKCPSSQASLPCSNSLIWSNRGTAYHIFNDNMDS
ncbi:hypothetical protein I3842_11G083200 [Carya illinoinensis]|uniref:Uncharacterized protein n=1 Tax=Carya illinoinensis TaxID=32201 RepID=A0A922DNB3_CARIL|nr:hypothetical protein I3842_11G083200 [Carya illinoinensis]